MFWSKNKIERGMVQTYWNDGLLDVLAGLGVLLIGIVWQLDLVPLGAAAPAILIPLWIATRKRITGPLIGRVEFSDSHERRQRRFLHSTLGMGCLLFLLGVGIYYIIRVGAPGGDGARNWIAALPAALLGLLSLFTWVFTRLERFLLYTAVLLTSGVGVVLYAERPGVAMLYSGTFILVVGSVRLVSFIGAARRSMTEDVDDL